MALTHEQAKAQWIANNPPPLTREVSTPLYPFGTTVELTPEEYDQAAEDAALALVSQSEADDEAATRAELRRKYRQGMNMMDAILALPSVPAGTLNLAQASAALRAMDGAIRDLARFNKGLLDALKAAGTLLDDAE